MASKLVRSRGLLTFRCRAFTTARSVCDHPSDSIRYRGRPVIFPVYSTTNIDGTKFKINCSNFKLKKALDAADPEDGTRNRVPVELQTAMRDAFDNYGIIHLTNTGLDTLQEMKAISEVIIGLPDKYKGGSNSRGNIIKNVYEVGAPKEAHLHYHHEMAYIDKSTSMLAFMAYCAVPGKGWSYVSDQAKMTPFMLGTELGQKLKEKGLCYQRCLTDRRAYPDGSDRGGAVYNHWQRSFDTEDPDEAQHTAESMGLKVEWTEDPLGMGGKYMVTKFFIDAYEYFPRLDRNLMFASVADDSMWFDGWPGIMELAHEKRPLKLSFGDETDISYEEFEQWIAMYDAFGMPIKWEKGDVAIICNWRWAHGRPAYTLEEGEERELGVMLGKTFQRLGQKEGKW